MVRQDVWAALVSTMISGLGLPAMAQVGAVSTEQGQAPRTVRFDIRRRDSTR